MNVVPFLILFPFVVAALLYCIRVTAVRRVIAYIASVIIMGGVGVLVAQWLAGGCEPIALYYETELADHVILGAVILLMFVVTFLCFKYKKYWISLLSIIPTIGITYLELCGPELEEINHVYIDYLSVLMCIIIGVIGGLIIIYGAGYMHGYHQLHKEFEDRRRYFFALLFIFLGAMFGFVLSSSLLWIDLFWEITSICSFMLIGYTRTEEAINNSFRALWMNLLGGTFLAVGIIYMAYTQGTVSLQALIASGIAGEAVAILPVAFIAFAALTKAAQLPFSSWLLGAMVAPTPSSALLHSATMVKAGIYILFRLGPAMANTTTGTMISFVGGFTFFMASIMANSQSDGKGVLAFSTVSNLGLMVACAGVGMQETIWAGVFLMIFHSVSKSLLFQDIGATENAMHSRDIEDMTGLIYRLPRLGIFMFIGIVGMYLAPFGMLISKWSALKACVDERNIMLVIFICFGSSTTMLYWTKWLNKLIASTNSAPINDITKKNEIISLSIHAVLMIGLCALFPLISKTFVESLLTEMFGESTAVLPQTMLYALVAIILFIFLAPIISYFFASRKRVRQKLSYMNGINQGDNASFTDSFGEAKDLVISNYYFNTFFSKRKLMPVSEVLSAAVIIVMLCMIVGGVA